MTLLRQVDGWLFPLVGLGYAAPLLRKLVRARRGEAGVRAITASEWSYLPLALMFVAEGVLVWFGYPNGGWLGWLPAALGAAWLLLRGISGIESRRRADLSWWRFWARVLPPERTSTGPGDASPALVLSSGTVDLIRRIESVVFGTTRLSAGYDEKEVDVFLDRLIAVLSHGGQLDREALGHAQFARTWLRRGYRGADVDNFLLQIAAP